MHRPYVRAILAVAVLTTGACSNDTLSSLTTPVMIPDGGWPSATVCGVAVEAQHSRIADTPTWSVRLRIRP